MSDSPVRRPTVWVNCAVSLDGRLAYAGGKRAMLSGPEDLARVQRMRAEADAVVVGVGTVIADDPSLRVHWEMLDGSVGKEPWRVILDSKGRTPPNARVLDGSQPTIIATGASSTRVWPEKVRVVRALGEHVDLPHLLAQLYDLGMHTIMIEGGSKVLTSVLRTRLFDRLTVFVAPVLIGGTSAPSLLAGAECEGPEGSVPLARTGVAPLDGGVLLTFVPADAR